MAKKIFSVLLLLFLGILLPACSCGGPTDNLSISISSSAKQGDSLFFERTTAADNNKFDVTIDVRGLPNKYAADIGLYTSSSSVAVVSNFKQTGNNKATATILAKNAGNAELTVRVEDKTQSFKVNISEPVRALSVKRSADETYFGGAIIEGQAFYFNQNNILFNQELVTNTYQYIPGAVKPSQDNLQVRFELANTYPAGSVEIDSVTGRIVVYNKNVLTGNVLPVKVISEKYPAKYDTVNIKVFGKILADNLSLNLNEKSSYNIATETLTLFRNKTTQTDPGDLANRITLTADYTSGLGTATGTHYVEFILNSQACVESVPEGNSVTLYALNKIGETTLDVYIGINGYPDTLTKLKTINIRVIAAVEDIEIEVEGRKWADEAIYIFNNYSGERQGSEFNAKISPEDAVLNKYIKYTFERGRESDLIITVDGIVLTSADFIYTVSTSSFIVPSGKSIFFKYAKGETDGSIIVLKTVAVEQVPGGYSEFGGTLKQINLVPAIGITNVEIIGADGVSQHGDGYMIKKGTENEPSGVILQFSIEPAGATRSALDFFVEDIKNSNILELDTSFGEGGIDKVGAKVKLLAKNVGEAVLKTNIDSLIQKKWKFVVYNLPASDNDVKLYVENPHLNTSIAEYYGDNNIISKISIAKNSIADLKLAVTPGDAAIEFYNYSPVGSAITVINNVYINNTIRLMANELVNNMTFTITFRDFLGKTYNRTFIINVFEAVDINTMYIEKLEEGSAPKQTQIERVTVKESLGYDDYSKSELTVQLNLGGNISVSESNVEWSLSSYAFTEENALTNRTGTTASLNFTNWTSGTGIKQITLTFKITQYGRFYYKTLLIEVIKNTQAESIRILGVKEEVYFEDPVLGETSRDVKASLLPISSQSQNLKIKWASTNESIAKVEPLNINGTEARITIYGIGNTSIYAYAADSQKSIFPIRSNIDIDSGLVYDSFDVLSVNGEGEYRYKISTISDLNKIRTQPDKNYELINDLYLTESWSPILNFSGSLYGNGFTIRNLFLESTSTLIRNFGLFDTIREEGYIENLYLEIGNINVNVTRNISAGSVAAVNYGTITNVVVNNAAGKDIRFNIKEDSVAKIGGIVGSNYGTLYGFSVSNLNLTVNAGNTESLVGGIAGENTNIIDGGSSISYITPKINVSGNLAYTGGVAGINFGAISNLNVANYNNAVVSGYTAGGVAGYSDGGALYNIQSNIKIESSGTAGGIIGIAVNSVIRSATYIAMEERSIQGLTAGGIIGFAGGNVSGEFLFVDSYKKEGSIEGQKIGGIIGETGSGSVVNISKTASGIILKTTNSVSQVGGFAGVNYGNLQITDCYFNGEIYLESGESAGYFAGSILDGTVEIINAYVKGTAFDFDGIAFLNAISGTGTEFTIENVYILENIVSDLQGATSLASSQFEDYMNFESIFDGFDFDIIWTAEENFAPLLYNEYGSIIRNEIAAFIDVRINPDYYSATIEDNGIRVLDNKRFVYIYNNGDIPGNYLENLLDIDIKDGNYVSKTNTGYKFNSLNTDIAYFDDSDNLVILKSGEVIIEIVSLETSEVKDEITIYLIKLPDGIKFVNERNTDVLLNDSGNVSIRKNRDIFIKPVLFESVENISGEITETIGSFDYISIINTSSLQGGTNWNHVTGVFNSNTAANYVISVKYEINMKAFDDSLENIVIDTKSQNVQVFEGATSVGIGIVNLENGTSTITQKDSLEVVVTIKTDVSTESTDNIKIYKSGEEDINLLGTIFGITDVKAPVYSEAAGELTAVYQLFVKEDAKNQNIFGNYIIRVEAGSSEAAQLGSFRINKNKIEDVKVYNYSGGEVSVNSSGNIIPNGTESANFEISPGKTGLMKINLYPYYSNISEVEIKSSGTTGSNNMVYFRQYLASGTQSYEDETSGQIREQDVYQFEQANQVGSGLKLNLSSKIQNNVKVFDGWLYVSTDIDANARMGETVYITITTYYIDDYGVRQIGVTKEVPLTIMPVLEVAAFLAGTNQTEAFIAVNTTFKLDVGVARLPNAEITMDAPSAFSVIEKDGNIWTIKHTDTFSLDYDYSPIYLKFTAKGVEKTGTFIFKPAMYTVDEIYFVKDYNPANPALGTRISGSVELGLLKPYNIGVRISLSYFDDSVYENGIRITEGHIWKAAEEFRSDTEHKINSIKNQGDTGSGKINYGTSNIRFYETANGYDTNYEIRFGSGNERYNDYFTAVGILAETKSCLAIRPMKQGTESGLLIDEIFEFNADEGKFIYGETVGSAHQRINRQARITLDIVYTSSEDMPIPIATSASNEENVRQLASVLTLRNDNITNRDANYILMNDVVISEWPFAGVAASQDANAFKYSANFASFDGNNKTITLLNSAFKSIANNYSGQSLNLGLFGEISQNTIIKNVRIGIVAEEYRDENETISGGLDFSFGKEFIGSVNINFGLLAGINNGVVTNCEAVLVEPNLVSVDGKTQYRDANGNIKFNPILNNNGNKAGVIIAPKATVAANITAGSLIGINGSWEGKYGFVTNSRSEVGITVGKIRAGATESNDESMVEIGGSFIVGGFVGVNNYKISSSYLRFANVNNFANTALGSATGGFVGNNNGYIMYSYVEGAISQKADYFRNLDISTLDGTKETVLHDLFRSDVNSVYSVGLASAGFVFSNNGVISNSYSNIIMKSSTARAGFVYINEESGEIEYSYTFANVEAPASEGEASQDIGTFKSRPFIGVSNTSGTGDSIQNRNLLGGITNSYFLDYNAIEGTEAQGNRREVSYFSGTEVASALSPNSISPKKSDEDKITFFAGFAFNVVESEAKYSIWTFSNVNTGTNGFKKPNLVSANQKTLSERVLTSEKTNGEVTEYYYGEEFGTPLLGEYENPILIYSANRFNEIVNDEKTGPEIELASSKPVRYVRDWANGNSVNANNHWVEIEAIDKNGVNRAMGRGGSYLTNGTVRNGNGNMLTDGNKDKDALLDLDIGLNYVQIDLGAVYDISSVNIWHYYGDARTYYDTKTEVSADGIIWETIFDSAVSGTYKETADGNKIAITRKESSNKNNYRLICDISFEGNDIAVLTTNENFTATLDGNGMKISNISINAEDTGTQDKIGLFRTIQGTPERDETGKLTGAINSAVIKALTLEVSEIEASDVDYVGALAGEAKNVSIFSVHVVPNDLKNPIIKGKSFVGGLVGKLSGESRIFSISSSVDIKSTKSMSDSMLSEDAIITGSYALNIGMPNEIPTSSYVGGVIGVADCERGTKLGTQPHINSIYNNNTIRLSGEGFVGGIIGYVGSRTAVSDIKFTAGTDGQSTNGTLISGSGYVGGVVGENRGSIYFASVVNAAQDNIDKINPTFESNNIARWNIGQEDLFGGNDGIAGPAISRKATGGLVGFNNLGNISFSYSKVNINNTKSPIAGGVAGVNYGGRIEQTYTTASVTAGSVVESVTASSGGIIGKNLTRNTASLPNTTLFDVLALNNYNSIAYERIAEERLLKQNRLQVGGIFGDQKMPIEKIGGNSGNYYINIAYPYENFGHNPGDYEKIYAQGDDTAFFTGTGDTGTTRVRGYASPVSFLAPVGIGDFSSIILSNPGGGVIAPSFENDIPLSFLWLAGKFTSGGAFDTSSVGFRERLFANFYTKTEDAVIVPSKNWLSGSDAVRNYRYPALYSYSITIREIIPIPDVDTLNKIGTLELDGGITSGKIYQITAAYTLELNASNYTPKSNFAGTLEGADQTIQIFGRFPLFYNTVGAKIKDLTVINTDVNASDGKLLAAPLTYNRAFESGQTHFAAITHTAAETTFNNIKATLRMNYDNGTSSSLTHIGGLYAAGTGSANSVTNSTVYFDVIVGDNPSTTDPNATAVQLRGITHAGGIAGNGGTLSALTGNKVFINTDINTSGVLYFGGWFGDAAFSGSTTIDMPTESEIRIKEPPAPVNDTTVSGSMGGQIDFYGEGGSLNGVLINSSTNKLATANTLVEFNSYFTKAGAAGSEIVNYTANQSIILPKLTKSGQMFLGWFIDSTDAAYAGLTVEERNTPVVQMFKNGIHIGTKVLTGPRKLIAKWDNKSYTTLGSSQVMSYAVRNFEKIDDNTINTMQVNFKFNSGIKLNLSNTGNTYVGGLFGRAVLNNSINGNVNLNNAKNSVPINTNRATYLGGLFGSASGFNVNNAVIDNEAVWDASNTSDGTKVTALNGSGFVENPVTTGHGYAIITNAAGQRQTFSYTGGIQTATLNSGSYILETWGATGGNGGGLGGYSRGILNVTTTAVHYVVVGGAGTAGNTGTAGGYNGGGNITATTDGNGGSGGGATHIATATGLLSDLENNKSAVLIVAGGGAGNCASGTTIQGHGGGPNGLAAIHPTPSYSAGLTNSTQSSSGGGSVIGGFGKGAAGARSAGGGGWFGGSSAPIVAAGGSGYVGGVVDGVSYAATATTSYTSTYVGGVAGEFNKGTINNSENRLLITATGINYQGNIGGLAGRVNTGPVDIINSVNNVNITTTHFGDVGGLVGFASGNLTITNSYNLGNIIDNGYNNDVGGLIAAGAAVTITNSFNKGNVIGRNWVGGLLGTASGVVNIENSYNLGDVNATNYAGGFIGEDRGNATVINSYSTGKISAKTAGGIFGTTGGITGTGNSRDNVIYNPQVKLDKVFFNGQVSGSVYQGAIVGYTGNATTLVNVYYPEDTTGGIDAVGNNANFNSSARKAAELLAPLQSELNGGAVYNGFSISRKETLALEAGVEGLWVTYTGGFPVSATGDVSFALLNWRAIPDTLENAKIREAFRVYQEGGTSALLGVTNRRPTYIFPKLLTNASTVENIGTGDNLLTDYYVLADRLISTSGLAGNYTEKFVFSGVLLGVNLDAGAVGAKQIIDSVESYPIFRTLSGVFANFEILDARRSVFPTISGGVIYGVEMNVSSLGTITYNSQGAIANIATGNNIIGASKITGNITAANQTALYIGGFIGSSEGTLVIINSRNEADVSGGQKTGGFVGNAAAITIINSSNSGNISIDKTDNLYAGGLLGYSTGVTKIVSSYNTGNITGGVVGGLFAYNNNVLSTIDRSFNLGNCDGYDGTTAESSGRYAGGLAGAFLGSNSETQKITNSYNLGNIKGRWSGGLVGYANNFIVENSFNGGDISTKDTAGGLVGNLSNVSRTVKISNSYNSGKITSTVNNKAGGLIGNILASGIITNCYNLGDIIGDRAGGFIGDVNNITVSITGANYVAGAIIGTTKRVVGSSNTTYSNVYYDYSLYAGAERNSTNKTTAEMVSTSTASGTIIANFGGTGSAVWNFSTAANAQYPSLKNIAAGTPAALDASGNPVTVNGRIITAGYDGQHKGSKVNPHNIGNINDFEKMANGLTDNTKGETYSKYDAYLLTASIDFQNSSTKAMMSHKTIPEFSGRLQGAGNIIYNFFVNTSDTNGNAGLFGKVVNASIYNLTFKSTTINGTYIISDQTQKSALIAGESTTSVIQGIDAEDLKVDASSKEGGQIDLKGQLAMASGSDVINVDQTNSFGTGAGVNFNSYVVSQTEVVPDMMFTYTISGDRLFDSNIDDADESWNTGIRVADDILFGFTNSNTVNPYSGSTFNGVYVNVTNSGSASSPSSGYKTQYLRINNTTNILSSTISSSSTGLKGYRIVLWLDGSTFSNGNGIVRGYVINSIGQYLDSGGSWVSAETARVSISIDLKVNKYFAVVLSNRHMSTAEFSISSSNMLYASGITGIADEGTRIGNISYNGKNGTGKVDVNGIAYSSSNEHARYESGNPNYNAVSYYGTNADSASGTQTSTATNFNALPSSAAGSVTVNLTSSQIVIYTNADFVTFMHSAGNYNYYSGKTVYLAADLNLSAYNTQNKNAINIMEEFRGTFNGQGYTIYNFNGGGFINNNYGSIMNLRFADAVMTGKEGAEVNAGFTAYNRTGGKIINCFFNGVLRAGSAGLVGFNETGAEVTYSYAAAYNQTQRLADVLVNQGDIYFYDGLVSYKLAGTTDITAAVQGSKSLAGIIDAAKVGGG